MNQINNGKNVRGHLLLTVCLFELRALNAVLHGIDFCDP